MYTFTIPFYGDIWFPPAPIPKYTPCDYGSSAQCRKISKKNRIKRKRKGKKR